MLYRKWDVNEYTAQQVQSLAQQLNIESLLAKVLLSKGISEAKQAQETYLGLHPLSDPFMMKDMEKAVQRIHAAIENQEKIVIYGDYDVDGVCATATLFSYLESIGAQVFYKLPNRETEGYGLNSKVLQVLKNKGVDLVITVDNGIAAVDEIAFANGIGLDVIVTDHHLPKNKIPDAFAVVDPLQKDDISPCKTLSGVGVAFKLVCALENAPCEEMLDYFADLVCVGTVADLMLLEGENRTLVKAGLELLNQYTRQGFESLAKVCGIYGKEITSETIAYNIAPRINAAGRMGDATAALELLLCEDEETGQELANQLEQENSKRQETQNKIAEEITQEILQDKNLVQDRVIVVWSDKFHPGVIGIVASHLVERYGKPAIVLTKDGDEYKGSGRSVPAFSLHQALEHTKQHLVRFGGHELAAGLAVEEENLEIFRKAINAFANENQAMAVTQSLDINCKVDLKEITQKSVQQISFLAPFGNGNENPLFMVEGVQIAGVFPVSEGKHIRIKVKQGDAFLQGILFQTAPQEFAYKTGDYIDLAVALSLYEGASGCMVSARIKEVRPSQISDKIIEDYDVYKLFQNKFILDAPKKQLLCPTREQVIEVYRLLQGEKVSCDDLRPLFVKLGHLPSCKIQIIIDVLCDLGLIEAVSDSQKNYYRLIKVQEKRDLMSSDILKSLQ